MTGALADRFAAAMTDCLPGPLPARLGIALSGGGDSVALMALLADWAAPRGVTLAAATVDHGLRAASTGEAAAAGRLARDMGLSHDTLHWEHPARLRGNLQDAARRARLRLIAAWAAERGIGAVAFGHTLDDQAETVLLRLARGSGVDGLSAMAPRRWHAGLWLLRPLLGLRRAALRAELTRRGLSWAEDPTNDDPRFDRVKARRALAALAPLGIAPEGLARTARHLATARAALEAATQAAWAGHCRTGAGGEVWLNPGGFAALPEELRLRLLARALGWISGADYRPRRSALERLAAALATGQGGTLQGCRALPRRGEICITREPRSAEAAAAVPLGALWDGRWRLSGPALPGAEVRALGTQGLRACPGWRDAGLPREVLRATPALWQGDRLCAAPLAGQGAGWQARLCPGGGAPGAIVH